MIKNSCSVDLKTYKDHFKSLSKLWYKEITVNTICSKVLGIHYMDYGPHWTINKHKHSFFECHYVTENNVFTTSDGIEYEVTPGQFYILAPGVLHSHCQKNNIGHIGFSIRWEMLLHNDLKTKQANTIQCRQMVESLNTIASHPLNDDGTIINAMIHLLELGKKDCLGLELELAFFQIILKLNQFCNSNLSHQHLASEMNQNTLNNNIINNTILFIEDNYYQDIDVNDVANSVHLSYSHLSRLYKRLLGETVNQYIKKVRLKKATYLLKCTDKDIACIASEVGYNSEYYFCSDFKKNIGMSPGNYRKTITRLSE